MALVYPLSLPAVFKSARVAVKGRTSTGANVSPITFSPQIYVSQGQSWEATITLANRKRAEAEQVVAFMLALNGLEGNFYLGDTANKTPQNVLAGWLVDAGAVAGTTVLPIKSGSGTWSLGDWLQVGAIPNNYLHKVVQVNAGSLDVFPKLRSAYANNTTIITTNPVGKFRMVSPDINWSIDLNRIYSVELVAMEDVG